ncbi:MAG: hypothetical protein AAGD07_18010 [Planctomycetota bacterium]
MSAGSSMPHDGPESFAENPYAPSLGIGEADPIGASPTDVEAFRKHHLNHEASVKAVGLLYLLSAIFLVFAGVLSLGGAVGNAGRAQVSTTALVSIGVGYLLFGFFQGFVGVSIRKFKPWSRIAGIVLSIPGLIGFPVGTLISAYFIYLFASKKGRVVFSERYKEVMAETPHIKYKTSLVVKVLAGVLLAVIVLGLAILAIGVLK